MTIRAMQPGDIPACAEILQSVYNNEGWQCQWTQETGCAYLTDFLESRKFVGYVLEVGGIIVGAVFAHEKIWWNGSELFVDELFVKPEQQGKGYGAALIRQLNTCVRERGLAGITLTTSRYAPAPLFYQKLGFQENPSVMAMYLEG